MAKGTHAAKGTGALSSTFGNAFFFGFFSVISFR